MMLSTIVKLMSAQCLRSKCFCA